MPYMIILMHTYSDSADHHSITVLWVRKYVLTIVEVFDLEAVPRFSIEVGIHYGKRGNVG